MSIPAVSTDRPGTRGPLPAPPPRSRVVRWVGIAVVVAALAGVVGGGSVRAAEGTTVSEVECGILLPGILPDGRVVSTTGLLVITAGGTATLTCRGTLDPALAPEQTVVITDVPCALGEGGTVGESHAQVTPSGEVLLVCHNNPGSAPLPPSGED